MRIFFFLRTILSNKRWWMSKLKYHPFSIYRETRDVGSDHQWLIISQKENQTSCASLWKYTPPLRKYTCQKHWKGIWLVLWIAKLQEIQGKKIMLTILVGCNQKTPECGKLYRKTNLEVQPKISEKLKRWSNKLCIKRYFN